MGYTISKSGKTYRIIYKRGEKENRNIPKDSREALELGFRPEMTFEEAKHRAGQIRDEQWAIDHAEKEAKRRAIEQKYKKLRSAFLSDEDVEEFERDWIPEKRIRREHWHTVQRIAFNVGIHPSSWYKLSSKIYEEFAKNQYSPNYCKKLLRYLNIWGYYLCEKHNRPWKDVEGPSGFWKRKVDQEFTKRIKRSSFESSPLTLERLEDKRHLLEPEHYNWLKLSVLFGLRPREVDNLKKENSALWYISKDREHKFILNIFQEKLEERGIAKDKCWKLIPTHFPEQVAAIPIIRSKQFEQPLAKTIKRVFGETFTAYGGRKNFVPWLRSEGFELEVASRWLGHLSIKTTEKSYAEVRKVIYRPPLMKRTA